MSLLFHSLKVSNATATCPSCSRLAAAVVGGSIQQVRWKTKLHKSTNITVRLLQDIPKFGKKGSILPVTRGRMRNIWFPYGMADYIILEERKKLSSADIMAERDVSFRPDLEKKKDGEVKLELLTPREAIIILETFLPSSLQFARSVKAESHDNSIHGSVTTSDIATTIRTLAAASGGDAPRVVIGPENIKFAEDELDGGDKIRRLGSYTYEVHLKDTNDIVRRKVLVHRQSSMLA